MHYVFVPLAVVFSGAVPVSSDGYVTLESLAHPGHYVGVDSDGSVTVPDQTDATSENAHFTPTIKVHVHVPYIRHIHVHVCGGVYMYLHRMLCTEYGHSYQSAQWRFYLDSSTNDTTLCRGLP